MYDTWLNLVFKIFLGGLTAAALYKAVLVGLTPLMTTKGLVVMCELPSLLCFVWFLVRGPLVFDALSPTMLCFTGDGLAILGLASKLLVARFWRRYYRHQFTIRIDRGIVGILSGIDFVDPVQSEPVLSLAIVAVCFIWQSIVAAFTYHFASSNSEDARLFLRKGPGAYYFSTYVAIQCYYLYSAIAVFRALTDRRSRAMSVYLLVSASFMLLHLVAIISFATKFHYKSEYHFGLVMFCVYLSRAGTALCSISIFHTHQNGAVVFLENEVQRLVGAVEKLEEEKNINEQLAHQNVERKDQEIARLQELNHTPSPRWLSQLPGGGATIFPSMT